MKTQIRVRFKHSSYEGGKHAQLEVNGSYQQLREDLAAGHLIAADKVRYDRDVNGLHFVTSRSPQDFTLASIAQMELNQIPMRQEGARDEA